MTIFLGEAELDIVGVVGLGPSSVAESRAGGEADGKGPKASALSLGEGGDRIREGSGDIGGLISCSGWTRAVVEAFGSSEGNDVSDGDVTTVPCIRAEFEFIVEPVSGFDLNPLFAVWGVEMDLPPSRG